MVLVKKKDGSLRFWIDLRKLNNWTIKDAYFLPHIEDNLDSFGMDITLDGILTVLDEHYNNVKALDALNQEVFQLQMGQKEMVSEWGVHLLRHLQILVVTFPEHFLPEHITELTCDHFYGGLPKQYIKQWWHTSRQAVMQRPILIISEQYRMSVVFFTQPEVGELAGQDGQDEQTIDCIYCGATGLL